VDTNLTITIDPETLRKARVRALQDGTSVNAFLRACLEDYVDESDRTAQAVAAIRRLMDAGELHWGSRTWSRDELHER
jgi:plasmid stability protein